MIGRLLCAARVWWLVLCACLLGMGVAATPAGALDNWPMARAYICRPAASPPTIDGLLDDPCWAAADPAAGFHPQKAERDTWADPATTLRVCYDAQALYLAFECAEPNVGGIKAAPHPRDFDVYTEDMVALLFDVGHRRGAHYDMELAVSAVGTQYDFAWGYEESWNGEWTAATRLFPAENRWTCELRIPFADTRRVPKKGDLWGMQAMRWRYAGGPETVSLWSAVPGAWSVKFWESATFGHLFFDSAGTILARQVKGATDHLRPHLEEAYALAQHSSAPEENTAIVNDLADRLEALERAAADAAALTGDQWADTAHASARTQKDFDDFIWPLRIEELFSE